MTSSSLTRFTRLRLYKKQPQRIHSRQDLIRDLKNLQRGELFHPQIAGDEKDDGSCDLTNPHWGQDGDAAF